MILEMGVANPKVSLRHRNATGKGERSVRYCVQYSVSCHRSRKPSTYQKPQ
jgi:hypothetical protein